MSFFDWTKSEKESPTCSRDTFRGVLTLTVQNNWSIQAIDIKTAFLQGEHIDRDIFVVPPPEANCSKGYIWKLSKCIYGLSDASLKLYSIVKAFVSSNSGYISKTDPALLDPRPMAKGSYKISCLSVRPSFRPSVRAFSRNSVIRFF